MPQAVTAYLEYLREMARKVAYRGTFLNVLHRKPRRSPERYLNWDEPHNPRALARYLAAVEQDIRSQDGRALFLGIGLLVGKLAYQGTVNLIASPLIMLPIEVDPPEGVGDSVTHEVEWSAASLNYDLVTAIIERTDTVDPEDAIGLPNQIHPSSAKAINDVEASLGEQVERPGVSQRLAEPSYVESLLTLLRQDIPAFRERIVPATTDFRLRDLPSMMDGHRLTWFNHRFAFMGAMPDSLSAYEALNDLCALHRR